MRVNNASKKIGKEGRGEEMSLLIIESMTCSIVSNGITS